MCQNVIAITINYDIYSEGLIITLIAPQKQLQLMPKTHVMGDLQSTFSPTFWCNPQIKNPLHHYVHSLLIPIYTYPYLIFFTCLHSQLVSAMFFLFILAYISSYRTIFTCLHSKVVHCFSYTFICVCIYLI